MARIEGDDVDRRQLVRELHDIPVPVLDAGFQPATLGLGLRRGQVLARSVDVDRGRCARLEERDVDGADACPDIEDPRPTPALKTSISSSDVSRRGQRPGRRRKAVVSRTQ